MIKIIPPKSALVATVVAALLLLFQIIPLVWGRPFYFDWSNHVWLTSYYADHLRHFGSFPATIDVAQGFGEPSPLFYGVFLYPFLALLAALTGADPAVRILSALLFVAPMLSFTALFRSFTRNLSLAILLAVVVNSSVYQMTNLYARSALTEFFAYQLLLLCISLIAFGSTRNSRLGSAAILLGFALGALSLGSHPITFYTFSLFTGPLLILIAFSAKRVISVTQAPFLVIGALGAALVLAPWLVNVVKYGGHIGVTITDGAAGKLYYFPTSIDSLWGRIGIFYVDPRVLTDGIGNTSTPFLDAPFSVSLLLTLTAVSVRLSKVDKSEILRLIAPTALVFLALVISVIPPDVTPSVPWTAPIVVSAKDGIIFKILSPIQFVYRLAGAFSLAMTVALVAAAAAGWRREVREPGYRMALYASAFLALFCAGQRFYLTYAEFSQFPKMSLQTDAMFMSTEQYRARIKDVRNYPVTFYGRGAYAMPLLFPGVSAEDADGREAVTANVVEWDQLVAIACKAPCLIKTNIAPSKFTRVTLDGAEADNVRINEKGNLDLLAGAGNHSLQINRAGKLAAFVVASVWAVLFWLLVSSLFFVAELAKYRRRHRPLSETPNAL